MPQKEASIPIPPFHCMGRARFGGKNLDSTWKLAPAKDQSPHKQVRLQQVLPPAGKHKHLSSSTGKALYWYALAFQEHCCHTELFMTTQHPSALFTKLVCPRLHLFLQVAFWSILYSNGPVQFRGCA